LNAIQKDRNGKQWSQVRYSFNDFRVGSEKVAQTNPKYQNNGGENYTNEHAISIHDEDREFRYSWMSCS